MPQILIDSDNHKLVVPILVTATQGKIRIKNRTQVNEYGTTVASVSEGFTANSYVEWMIGYDVVWGGKGRDGVLSRTTSEEALKKLAESTLVDGPYFEGANGKIKALYELSEYIYYFYQWGELAREDLVEIRDYLDGLSDDDLMGNRTDLQISRSELEHDEMDGFEFERTWVKYPLLICKLDRNGLLAEVKITENQKAAGIQPMLYLCFPVSNLRSDEGELVGRTAKSREVAYYDITTENIRFFLEALKLFGTLSVAHKKDVMNIIKTILG